MFNRDFYFYFQGRRGFFFLIFFKVIIVYFVEGLIKFVIENEDEVKQVSEVLKFLNIEVKDQKSCNEEDILYEYDYVVLEAKDVEDYQKNFFRDLEQEKRKVVIYEDLDDKSVKEFFVLELCFLKLLIDI